jgi:hypothetical protein
MRESSLSSTLITHGLVYILHGLLVGLVVHSGLFPYPRIALASHIGFTGNGTLFLALGICLHPSIWPFERPGSNLTALIRSTVWLAWAVPYSELINAFWGSTTMMKIAAGASTGASHAWKDVVVDVCHMVPSVLLIGTMMGLVGLALKGKRREEVDRLKAD